MESHTILWWSFRLFAISSSRFVQRWTEEATSGNRHKIDTEVAAREWRGGMRAATRSVHKGHASSSKESSVCSAQSRVWWLSSRLVWKIERNYFIMMTWPIYVTIWRRGSLRGAPDREFWVEGSERTHVHITFSYRFWASRFHCSFWQVIWKAGPAFLPATWSLSLPLS
jgi:hypothetical protein